MFEGAKAKVARAEAQVEELEIDFIRFFKSDNYAVDQTPDFETGEKTATYRVTRSFPHVWPVIIGEIVHNLRSSLDHAIQELTMLENGKPLENTEFPVFEDETKYGALKKNGDPTRISGLFKIRGIPDKAKAVVRDLQPFAFKERGVEDEPVVSIVHHLNRIDKHQTLHLCRRKNTDFMVKVIRDIHPIENSIPVGELQDGQVLARWKPAGRDLDDKPDYEFKIGFDVAFSDTLPILKMNPVIPICRGIVRGTSRVLHWLEDSVSDHAQASDGTGEPESIL